MPKLRSPRSSRKPAPVGCGCDDCQATLLAEDLGQDAAAALDWPATADVDGYRWTTTDAINAENALAADADLAPQLDAEALAYDRQQAEADLNGWLDALDADRGDRAEDRAAEDLYVTGLLPV